MTMNVIGYCQKRDCFAYDGMRCKILEKQIVRKDCPFYKDTETLEQGREDALLSLLQKGRSDLIAKYSNPENEVR